MNMCSLFSQKKSKSKYFDKLEKFQFYHLKTCQYGDQKHERGTNSTKVLDYLALSSFSPLLDSPPLPLCLAPVSFPSTECRSRYYVFSAHLESLSTIFFSPQLLHPTRKCSQIMSLTWPNDTFGSKKRKERLVEFIAS